MSKNAVGAKARSVLDLTSAGSRRGGPRPVETASRGAAAVEVESPRRKETFNLDIELMRRTRNAVAHLEGAPHWLCAGLSDFVQQALEEKLARVEEEYNEAQPFPEPPRPLKRGPKGRQ